MGIRVRLIPGALVIALIAGCKTAPQIAAPREADPVEARIEASLLKSKAESPLGPEVKVAAPIYSLTKTTVSYWGDASNLLQDVGKAMKWTFKVTGPQPRLPIYVQIDVNNVGLSELLSQIARQLSQRADIVVGQDSIELRYRSVN